MKLSDKFYTVLIVSAVVYIGLHVLVMAITN